MTNLIQQLDPNKVKAEQSQPQQEQTLIEKLSVGSPAMKPANDIAKMYGAYSAMLGEKIGLPNLEEAFSQTVAELETSPNSNTLTNIIGNLQGQTQAEAKGILREVLNNPQFTEEEKRVVSSGFFNLQAKPLTPQGALIEANIKEAVETQDHESLLNYGDMIKDISEYYQWKDDLLVDSGAKLNPNVLKFSIDWLGTYVLPFTEAQFHADLTSEMKDEASLVGYMIPDSSRIKGIFAPGATKTEVKEQFRAMPLEERKEAMMEFHNILFAKNDYTNLASQNSAVQFEAMRIALEDGYYTDSDAFLDNVFNLFDVAIVTRVLTNPVRAIKTLAQEKAIARGNFKGKSPQQIDAEIKAGETSKPAVTAQDLVDVAVDMKNTSSAYVRKIYDRWAKKGVEEVKGEPPIGSPASVQNATDPAGAKALHEEVKNTLGEQGEELAQSTYKTSKDEALLNDVTPQTGSGPVKPKTNMQVSSFDEALENHIKRRGQIELTEEEISKTLDVVREKALDNRNLSLRGEMSVMSRDEGGFKFGATYGPKQGSWTNPVHAVEDVMFGLKRLGVTEKDIKIMAQTPEGFVEIPFKQALEIADIDEAAYLARRTNKNKILSEKEGRISDETGKLARKTKSPKRGVTKYKVEGNDVPFISNFLVKVDQDFNINPYDITEFSNFTKKDMFGKEGEDSLIKRNIFDNFKSLMTKEGSLSRAVFPVENMIHPHLFLSAFQSFESGYKLTKILVDELNDYTKNFKSLSKERQDKVMDWKLKANAERIEFDIGTLNAQGFNPEEVELLAQWNRMNDNFYHLESIDLNRTLIKKGYQVISGNGNKLIAKEVALPKSSTEMVYNASTGKVEKYRKADYENFANMDYKFAALKSPEKIDGVEVKHVLLSNTKDAYLRNINENSDRLLNYIPGHFTVRYKHPYFVEKVRKGDKSGKAYAVATSDSVEDARRYTEKMSADDPEFDYTWRPAKERDQEEFWDDDNYDVEKNSGRISQRVRGQMLENISPTKNGSQFEHIQNPIESTIQTIQGLGNRISLKPYLNTYEKRMVDKYSDILKDGKFPSSYEDIRSNRAEDSARVREARGLYEYYLSLDKGYVNTVDNLYKSGLNFLAQTTGKITSQSLATAKVGKQAEDFLNYMATKPGPEVMGRKLAFNFFIAMNPLGQYPMQALQTLTLGSRFPKQFFSGKLMLDSAAMIALRMSEGIPLEASKAFMKKFGFEKLDYHNKVLKDYMDSGLSDSLTHHNFIQGGARAMADGSSTLAPKIMVNKAVAGVQKVGFGFGEETNLMATFMAHYNRASNNGAKTLTKREIDKVVADTRHWALGQTLPGQMPQNTNSFSLLFQFSVPVMKGLMRPFFDRGLTRAERAKWLANTWAMFGLGGGASLGIYNFMKSVGVSDDDANIEVDSPVFKTVSNGLTSLTLHHMAKAMGTEANLGTHKYSPTTLSAFDVYKALLSRDEDTGGLFGAIEASPSLRAYDRLFQVGRASVNHFFATPDKQFVDDALLTANITKVFSGFSNGFKARMALETQQIVSSSGKVIDRDVTQFEAIAQAFGLQTQDQQFGYELSAKLWEQKQEFYTDLDKWYKEFWRISSATGVSKEEQNVQIQMLKIANAYFGKNPKAMEYLQNKLQKELDIEQAEILLKAIGEGGWYMGEGDINSYIDALPDVTDEVKQGMKTINNSIQQSYNRYEQALKEEE